MQKTESLRLNKEFRTLYYHGRSEVHPLLVTYARKNRLGKTRVGITAGKKIGGAVRRNRARRLIREAFRTLPEPAQAGYDLVFVARARTVSSTMPRVREVMARQLRKLGVCRAAGEA